MGKLLDRAALRQLARFFTFLVMLYFFLAAIQLMGGAIKMAGADTANNLFGGLEANPMAGLAVGILATVLWQSSSVTTSMIVGLVGTGELSVAAAVPIVMGANIGTSITNTIVSLGHVTQGAAFRRAFAGATVHDIFNLLSVLILFPLEMTTGYLRRAATWLVTTLPLANSGGEFHSPVKAAVKWLAGLIQAFFQNGLGLEKGPVLAFLLFVVAICLIVLALLVITKSMRLIMADRIEQWINRVLKRSGLLGMAIGAGVTATVQSSSITTSLLVPMFGAGVLKLEAGFPIMLGANIGTTITALLAASVTGPAGLTIAVVHLLFNVSGTLIFFPIPYMRRIPIRLSRRLAYVAARNRVWVAVYIFGVFIVIPILGILIWK